MEVGADTGTDADPDPLGEPPPGDEVVGMPAAPEELEAGADVAVGVADVGAAVGADGPAGPDGASSDVVRRTTAGGAVPGAEPAGEVDDVADGADGADGAGAAGGADVADGADGGREAAGGTVAVLAAGAGALTAVVVRLVGVGLVVVGVAARAAALRRATPADSFCRSAAVSIGPLADTSACRFTWTVAGRRLSTMPPGV